MISNHVNMAFNTQAKQESAIGKQTSRTTTNESTWEWKQRQARLHSYNASLHIAIYVSTSTEGLFSTLSIDSQTLAHLGTPINMVG